MASCFYLLVRDISTEINDRGLISNINWNVGDDEIVIDEQKKRFLGAFQACRLISNQMETTLRHNEQ